MFKEAKDDCNETTTSEKNFNLIKENWDVCLKT